MDHTLCGLSLVRELEMAQIKWASYVQFIYAFVYVLRINGPYLSILDSFPLVIAYVPGGTNWTIMSAF